MLDERKRKLLYAVVREYIMSAQPVGSKKLVKRYGLNISPATVRNELALLEEMGFLTHPHTSAGRVPTETGYRKYVDSLADEDGLKPAEEKSISQFYSMSGKEIENLMSETSNFLASITNYLAIVFAPNLRKSLLKHVDLVLMHTQVVLVVIVTNTGWVAKRILKLGEQVEESDLARVERIVNERLNGLDLDGIYRRGRVELRGLVPGKWSLVERIIDEIVDCLKEREHRRVFLDGTANLLRHPEFESLDKVQRLLEVLEKGYSFLRFVEGVLESDRVIVRIGSENERSELRECSLIASSYRAIGGNSGTVGVLGPVRMDYPRAIGTVHCIAKNLTFSLESLWS